MTRSAPVLMSLLLMASLLMPSSQNFSTTTPTSNGIRHQNNRHNRGNLRKLSIVTESSSIVDKLVLLDSRKSSIRHGRSRSRLARISGQSHAMANITGYDDFELGKMLELEIKRTKHSSSSRSNNYLVNDEFQESEINSTSSTTTTNSTPSPPKTKNASDLEVDIVTKFLRIIENQHLLGENCTAGTDLNLGEGVADQYAHDRFKLQALLAVNRANMLTRLWKYAPEVMLSSEYLLHASVLSMVEFDEDIFAAGNCYDKLQYKGRWLYCPFAHRLQDQDGVLVKDLAVEYKYLSNSSEWFFIARENALKVINNFNQFSRGELRK